MKCRDIMTKYIKMCRPEASAKDAIKIMNDLNCGVVPVVDEKNEVIGIVTDRDIAIYTIMHGKNPEKTKLEEFMTKDVITVNFDDEIDTAITKMKDYKIRRIPVLDNNKKIVGILSIGDVAVTTSEEHEVFEALENISFPVSGAK
jgi:CBS domain-containing protein